MAKAESKWLGKKTEYPDQYNPEVLVAVPRKENREKYQLDDEALPFTGFDTWHAYELGFLTRKGLPVTGLVKIVYPANSTYLVESKSLKLYLNSLNMMQYGDTPEEGIEKVCQLIENDLGRRLECPVDVHFHNEPQPRYSDFSGYELLENVSGVSQTTFHHYTENPALLEEESGSTEEIKVATHLLRSNCKVTHQPDWGSAFIHMKSKDPVNKLSLLKYIVSLRNEYHFHEEICEMIYKRLWDQFIPEVLAVTCIYTRRGGIDICPSRANKKEYLPNYLMDEKTLTNKLLRQ